MKRLAVSFLPLALLGAPLPAQAPAIPPAPEVDITGSVLRVTDLSRSLKFYTDGLGLTVLMRIPEGAGESVILAPKGRTMPPIISLIQQDKDPAKSPPMQLGNGFSRVVLSVASSTQMYAHLKAAGYAPGGNGGGGIFFVTDPDGYRIEITQRGAGVPKR